MQQPAGFGLQDRRACRRSVALRRNARKRPQFRAPERFTRGRRKTSRIMKLPRFEDFKADFAADSWLEAAILICQINSISCQRIERAAHGESIIFLADDRFVIKIYVPGKDGFEREKAALEIARTSLKIPEIVAFGEIEGYKYLITTQLPGELMTRETWLKLESPEQISVLTQLAGGLTELHASDGAKIAFDWDKFIERQAATCFERQKACQVNEEVLGEIPAYLDENLKLLPAKPET